MVLEFEQAKQKIAELLESYMGIPAVQVLSDAPFTSLHKDFDSLSFLELQLLIEKEYSFEFEEDVKNPIVKLPTNASELANELIRQQQLHFAKTAKSSAVVATA